MKPITAATEPVAVRCQTCKGKDATAAIVTEEAMGLSDDIYNRSFLIDNSVVPEALSWMTWFGPKHMKTIGETALEGVKNLISLRPCASGYILVLMQEPYEDANPEHRRFREEIEEKIGLTAMYKNLE